MNVKATIQQRLAQLAAGGFPSGPQSLSLDTPAGKLIADLATIDRLACALTSLTLDSPKLAGVSLESLKSLSDALSRQLSYLLEPISLVECDADSATVQLRSNPPARDGDQTNYYEIVARRGGSITLCRYQKLPGDVRQITPAALTHEVLGRLGQDFVAALP